ncbi:MAG TPA: ribosome small subunit-dependent GTPase A [Spirochaeta sp.]|nr:ribosome small subunit-dependent GTPase A [Spirochaeta sp.]
MKRYDENGWGILPAEDEIDRCNAEELGFARVVRENRGRYQLVVANQSGDSFIDAEVSGSFRYCVGVAADYPAVGDWVAVRTEDGSFAVIEWIARRSSCFSRKAAGVTTEEQVIAANIDVIFLVFAINGGRNFMASGLERYLTVAWDSGAQPVVVLNKADLCSDEEREAAVLTAESSAPGVDIRLVSAVSGEGLDELSVGAQSGLEAGMTIALAGPSGVGKSTLINALAGNDVQKTGAQRDADLRGRHTTTHRELFRLESGLLMIDSPGMRELQLWADSGSADDAFSEIAELAENCRFSDCSHQGEPGCAVQAALASGELEHRRYENYLELKRELEYLERKQSEKAVGKGEQRWKDVSKLIRNMHKEKR